MNIELAVTGITAQNRRIKLIKAAHALSDQMGLGAAIDYPVLEKSHKYLDREWRNGGWVYTYPDTGGGDGGGSESTREPWDSSTDKAKELKAEDWGSPEQIAEMAQMPRTAKNREEATVILKEIARKGELKSRSGLTAILSNRNIPKIVSGKAITQSISSEAHFKASANLDTLFSNAIEPWKFGMNPNKNNADLKERRVLYAPMEYNGKIVPVKFTVKEFIDHERGTKVYSLEVIDVILKEVEDTGMLVREQTEKSYHSRTSSKVSSTQKSMGIIAKNYSVSPFDSRIPHLFDSVNEYLRKSRITYPNVEVVIRNITPQNRAGKFAQAMGALAKALHEPGTSKPRGAHEDHEAWLWPVQQELADYYNGYYAPLLNVLYRKVCKVFRLPPQGMDLLKKADTDPIRYEGNIIYKQDGTPLSEKEFKTLVKAMEDYLNTGTDNLGERFIMDNRAITVLLKKLALSNTITAMQALTLDNIDGRGHDLSWLRAENRGLPPAYQVAEQYLLQRITHLNTQIIQDMQTRMLWNIKERVPPAQTALDLFQQFGTHNRDWKRVADTESANIQNYTTAYQARADAGGKPVYLKRFELPGACPKCRQFDGVIALYTEAPAEDFKGDEFATHAVWDGKKDGLRIGTLHPYCRGSWLEYNKVDAASAFVGGWEAQWDKALTQAQKEMGTDADPAALNRRATALFEEERHGHKDL